MVELLEIVIRACEHEPASRYRSAREMAADLALVSGGKSVREIRLLRGRLRSMRVAAGVLGLAGLSVTGGLWWFCDRPKPPGTVAVAPGAGPISFSPDGKFLITADSRVRGALFCVTFHSCPLRAASFIVTLPLSPTTTSAERPNSSGTRSLVLTLMTARS